ncbi:anaphase promoting complex subunit 11 [Cyberlindnera jadinii NRRL Y-1542]|uniref:Anaphase-promoting complex subunit 11 n=1 Tax=Cyberlindnera jadinii (strain ATCC 18201 / CBS 1600 / BCRC 20928 / JCM 3617 / NBRC 0987 / NRRL Y-1542) TaxID=983966 RepID=A0A1E4S8Z2_CYBJN|nr:RING/U-box [Cyberlindnera jadinii NRRL Y-1542]ODV75986.1 RING/U-box [Cyberlindnera jadinii NRRL Y-1542]
MKVNIRKWNGVAIWSWDVPKEEVCGICRTSFDMTCSSCKFPGDQCPLVLGVCTHRFHTHCIEKWLEVETSKNLCPMCRQWFQEKTDDGDGGTGAHANTSVHSSDVVSTT